MKSRKNIVEVICFLLMLNFFYEGVHKIAYFNNYKLYITRAPLLDSFGRVLAYGVPLLEIALAILIILPKFRKVGLYTVITVQMLFIFWVMSVYLFTGYLFWPHHALWSDPTWMEKMSFALGLSWLALAAILLSRTKVSVRKDIPSPVVGTQSRLT